MKSKVVTVIALGITLIAALAHEGWSNENSSPTENALVKATSCDSIYDNQIEYRNLSLMRLRLSMPLYSINIDNQENSIALIADEDIKGDISSYQTSDTSTQESPVIATDPLGRPITESDVKSYMKATYRYIMTSLYGTLSSLVGLSAVEENKYYQIVSTLTGASIGSVAGYLMGRYGDKYFALNKIKKERLENAMVDMTYDAISENIDREEAMKAYQQFRRGQFTKGAIIGGTTGGALGAVGTILVARSFKGAAIGTLITGGILAPGGVIAGYVIEQEVNKEEAMKELNKFLDRKRDSSSLNFERDLIALKMSMQGFTNDKPYNHCAATDYILRLVDLRF